MIQLLQQEIRSLLSEIGVDEEIIELGLPPDPEMGDVSFPCFQLAKRQQKSPALVAQELMNKLEADHFERYSLIQDAAPVGPYLNFYVNTSRVVAIVLEEIKNKGGEYGSIAKGNGKKVLIEYPSQNSHKEFHIGHLRNVCIGNTLVALYRKHGFQITPVNYINDFGAAVAKCLWGILKFHSGKVPSTNRQRWLGEVYAEASAAAKDDPIAAQEIAAVQEKIESRDPEIWPLFQETRQWSLDGFEELLDELGAKHEAIFYESEVKDRGQQIVDELLQKGIAQLGEKGAVIIDLQPYNLDVALLRKGNGAGLYLTADLALAERKFKEHDIAESINITGIEQNFYFKQLFKVLELYGFTHTMTHIGYGLVSRSDGKMSSRLGNVILYEELRDEALAVLGEEVKSRHSDWPQEKIAGVSRTLALASLKFSMQKHEAIKNISFDLKESLSFDGYSAPYVLYVVARVNSLFKKAMVRDFASRQEDYGLLVEKEEKQIILFLARYPDVMGKALNEHNPAVITRYAFDLAQLFNEWYARHSVLEAAPELTQARLALAAATRQVLLSALSLLSIEAVEEM